MGDQGEARLCRPGPCEALGAAVAFQSLGDGLDADADIEGVGEPPGEHPAVGPVHDGHHVQKAALHRDIRDVRAPNLIGPLNGDSFRQVGVNPVLRTRSGGPGHLVDGLRAHQAHQTALGKDPQTPSGYRYLVRIDLVPNRDLLDRLSPSSSNATFALKSPLNRHRGLMAHSSFSRWNTP